MRVRTRKDLGLLIREARRNRGLTQARLAELIGVSRRWVVQVEQGNTSPDFRTLLRAFRSLELEMSVGARRESHAAREIANLVDSARRRTS